MCVRVNSLVSVCTVVNFRTREFVFVILLNVKRCYMKLFMFDFLGLQSCFYSSCIYMFPDHSDDFCITLTDFSGVQSISIDSSWFEQLGQPAGGVGVQLAVEGRVQDGGLEAPPPGAAAAQYPYTRNAK